MYVSSLSFFKDAGKLQRNKTVKDKDINNALIKFSEYAALAGIISTNILPVIVKSGYPVGCATPRFEHARASSPLSINQTDGANVDK